MQALYFIALATIGLTIVATAEPLTENPLCLSYGRRPDTSCLACLSCSNFSFISTNQHGACYGKQEPNCNGGGSECWTNRKDCDRIIDNATDKATLLRIQRVLDPSGVSRCFTNWKVDQNMCSGAFDPEDALARAPVVTCNKLGEVIMLELPHCDLRGKLPVFLNELKSLRSIDLSFNSLGGPIRKEWRNMTSLTTLKLNGNRLHGSIPEELGELPYLAVFSVDSNSLSGELPLFNQSGGFGDMGSMNRFSASNNRLRGPLRREWGAWSILTQLDLSNNLLGDDGSGLPGAWGDLGLQTLNLRNNSLECDVPQLWIDGTLGYELQVLDLSLNCIHANQSIVDALTTSSIALLDLTPRCVKMRPLITKTKLVAPYVFAKSNFFLDDPSQCWDWSNTRMSYYCASDAVVASLTELAYGEFSLAFKCFVTPFLQTKLRFTQSCMTAFFVPSLECYYDADATRPCAAADMRSAPAPEWDGQSVLISPTGSGDVPFVRAADSTLLFGLHWRVRFDVAFNFASNPIDEGGMATINRTFQNLTAATPTFVSRPCVQNTSIAINMTTSCAPCPSYHEGGGERTKHHARCDGTINALVGEEPAWRPASNLLPFYVCPEEATKGCQEFEEEEAGEAGGEGEEEEAGEEEGKQGHQHDGNNKKNSKKKIMKKRNKNVDDFRASSPAVDEESDNTKRSSARQEAGEGEGGEAEESEVPLDGAHCKDHHVGPLCSRCEVGYVLQEGACEECPSHGSVIAVFCAGVVALFVVTTLLIFLSVKPRRHVQDDVGGGVNDGDAEGEKKHHHHHHHHRSGEEDEQEEEPMCVLCCPGMAEEVNCDLTQLGCCAPLVQRLEKYRPYLERATITVKQIINHVTLVGPLRENGAAEKMSKAVKQLLAIQSSANSALFGSYAGTLQCLLPHSWSKVVLSFNTTWAVFACMFVAESLIFLAWTRRPSTAVTCAFFLSFVAFAPLAESAAKLLSLCVDYKFWLARDVLLGRNDDSNVMTSYSLLSSDLSQDCDDDFRKSYVVGGALTVCLFCAGLPLIIIGVYRSKWMAKRPLQRVELFGFLTREFVPSAWWWELLVMVRKLGLALVLAVFPNQSALQLQLYTLVVTLMIVCNALYSPLHTVAANRAERFSFASAIICASIMALVSAFPESSTVDVFASITVFTTQILAILAIIIFGHQQHQHDEHHQQHDHDNNHDDHGHDEGDGQFGQPLLETPRATPSETTAKEPHKGKDASNIHDALKAPVPSKQKQQQQPKEGNCNKSNSDEKKLDSASEEQQEREDKSMQEQLESQSGAEKKKYLD